MRMVVLASASGAPGCTTCAVGLGLTWPSPVMVVDANQHPNQSVLAGFLSGVDGGSRGLVNVLRSYRAGSPLDLLPEYLALSELDAESGEPWTAFLPGFAHPQTASVFAPVWSDFVAALESQDRDVILDCGRLGREGLPGAVAEAADVCLLVCQSTLTSLAGVRLYLPALVQQASEERTGLLVVGAGPYGRREIEKQFGVLVWGEVTFDPDRAAVHAQGAPPDARFDESPYVRSLRAVGQHICRRIDGDVPALAGAAS